MTDKMVLDTFVRLAGLPAIRSLPAVNMNDSSLCAYTTFVFAARLVVMATRCCVLSIVECHYVADELEDDCKTLGWPFGLLEKTFKAAIAAKRKELC